MVRLQRKGGENKMARRTKLSEELIKEALAGYKKGRERSDHKKCSRHSKSSRRRKLASSGMVA